MRERLDKILAHAGYGSRRDVKRLTHAGRVTVNGAAVREVAQKIDTDTAWIAVDGEKISIAEDVYLLLHKPAGVISANTDGLHRTVFDLLEKKYRLPYIESRLHCVGRLDVDTEGLLLLTTDGELTHHITSPKTHVAKKYFVRLADTVTADVQTRYTAQCAAGVHIAPEGKESACSCQPAALEWISDSECFLTITEGKFHQVKRMFKALGNTVSYLRRDAVGTLQLGAIPCGAYRTLTADEVQLLKNCCSSNH